MSYSDSYINDLSILIASVLGGAQSAHCLHILVADHDRDIKSTSISLTDGSKLIMLLAWKNDHVWKRKLVATFFVVATAQFFQMRERVREFVTACSFKELFKKLQKQELARCSISAVVPQCKRHHNDLAMCPSFICCNPSCMMADWHLSRVQGNQTHCSNVCIIKLIRLCPTVDNVVRRGFGANIGLLFVCVSKSGYPQYHELLSFLYTFSYWLNYSS